MIAREQQARLHRLDHDLRRLGHHLSRDSRRARIVARGPARRAFAGSAAGLVLTLAAAALRRAPSAAPRTWGPIALVGFLMNVLGNGLLVWAQQYVASGLAAVVVAMVPFWSVGVEALMPGGDRFTAPHAGRAWSLVSRASSCSSWPEFTVGGPDGRMFVAGVLAHADWRALAGRSARRTRSGTALGATPLASSALQMLFSGAMLMAIGTVARRVEPRRVYGAHVQRAGLSDPGRFGRRIHGLCLRAEASADLDGVALRVCQPDHRRRARHAAAVRAVQLAHRPGRRARVRGHRDRPDRHPRRKPR